METHLTWLLVATALVVVELLTGTCYLLVLGIAASAGAAFAYFGLPFWAQAVFAAFIALTGIVLVHRFRASEAQAKAINAIDVGQRVTLESWVNQAEGVARVHYRGTLWDAKVLGGRASGTTFYIRGIEGSTLHVAPGNSNADAPRAGAQPGAKDAAVGGNG